MGLLRFLPVLLAALIALGTYWLAEQARKSEALRPNSPLNPDFVIEGVRISRMNAEGTVQTIVNAVRMTHVPQSDMATLDQPRVLQNAPGKPPLTITADRGESRNDAEQVDLQGHVVITREATADAPTLVIRTELLHIRPDDDIAITDREVAIAYGQSTINGTGMQFSNVDRKLVIDTRARGVIAPPGTR